MRLFAMAGMAATAILLSSCASTYGPESLWGGYSERQLSTNEWIVQYSGNGYTSDETVQTFFLHHCATLALDKGYDGFRLETQILLTDASPTDGSVAAAILTGGHPRLVAVVDHGLDGKPYLSAKIELLKGPLPEAPGIVFNARALKTFLDPYVVGDLCGGNVCPHVHRYLFPDFAPSPPPAPPIPKPDFDKPAIHTT